jgi:hypothetical protein
MAADVIPFQPRPGSQAVRRPIDEPPLILILPVVRIERDETPAQRFGRFLNRILDSEPHT